ncbi:MAG: hypothetical protein K6G51_02530 [Sphaerochaetaceae bacterium]|nr:hypothetical protein [Sphaerochaetaceae bacterium]
MDRYNFIHDYWRYYKTLEKRLIEIISYVEIHYDNFDAFSNEYALLIQAAGAELDNFFKVFCGYELSERKYISDYAGHILTSYSDIVKQSVIIPDYNIEITPFGGWELTAPAQSLDWWKSFDLLKHNRAENGSKANQENVLNIFAALFLLETKYLSMIIKKNKNGKPVEPDIPDDKSSFFEMKDWNYRYVPLGNSFAVIDGALNIIYEQ